jgi:hypothetical protein
MVMLLMVSGGGEMWCMSDAEDSAVSGEIVAAPAADIRYEDASEVANVTVVVEYRDGRVKEYEAREPQDFQMNDPESISAQVFRQTGLALGAGGGFRGVTAGVPSLSLSFSAHPRYNLHIRNKRKGDQASLGA